MSSSSSAVVLYIEVLSRNRLPLRRILFIVEFLTSVKLDNDYVG